MIGLKDIPKIQKSAFTTRKKGNLLIDRLNIPWEVALPGGNQFGVASFKYGDNKIILDLSGVNFAGGSAVNPFVIPMGTGLSPETTTWHIEDPPAGTDGVQLVSPIRYFIDVTPTLTQLVSTPTGTATINVFVVWTFVRPLTFDSLGNIIAIGAEDRIDAAISPTQTTFS